MLPLDAQYYHKVKWQNIMNMHVESLIEYLIHKYFNNVQYAIDQQSAD